MKKLGLVTIRSDTGVFLKNQLDEVFDGIVSVQLYALRELTETVHVKEDLLIFS